MAELDLARSVLAKEEAEFMRSGDAVTEAERRAAEAEKALEELREAQAPGREGLAGRRDGIASEREQALAARRGGGGGGGRGAVGSLREDPARQGAARAVRACTATRAADATRRYPTQRRVLIQRGATIETCEACGVLLVRAGMIPARWTVAPPADAGAHRRAGHRSLHPAPARGAPGAARPGRSGHRQGVPPSRARRAQ